MQRFRCNCTNNTVVFTGDWHCGSRYAKKSAIKQMINTVKKEGYHLVLMGDLFDSITSKDKRHDGGMTDPEFAGEDPQYQAYKWVRDLLEPVKSQILYLHSGNHEKTLASHGEINLCKMLADALGVRYADYTAHVRFRFVKNNKSQSYKVHTTHGFLSGRKRGGKVNGLEDMAGCMRFDFVAAAHSHDLFVTSQEMLDLTEDEKEKVDTIWFCNTGSFLPGVIDGAGIPYSELKGFRRLKCGYIKATFEHHDKWINVEEVVVR